MEYQKPKTSNTQVDTDEAAEQRADYEVSRAIEANNRAVSDALNEATP